ncbi:hypothetical protein Dimus_012693 [Dionaea muscipula]
MGRPPSNGLPAFRFTHMEVAQMDAILQEHKNQVPAKEIIESLADKFSKSTERAGKIAVQWKQVWNWFQNRRYALRAKMVKSPGKLTVTPMPRDDVTSVRTVTPQPVLVTSGGKNAPENSQMEFEAKSVRDGAWYDVQGFLSHRYLETGDTEVLVRFAGFGSEEDEWINVCKHVRQRSLPCESTECVVVIPGDLILCFQEGKEQALYFDAHVLDAQRRRHDARGCRCRFLVRYDHDLSEEIVPLRKVCRRPETDYRLHVLHAANDSASVDPQKAIADPSLSNKVRMPSPHVAMPVHQTATATATSNPRVGITTAQAQVNSPPLISGTTRPVTMAPGQAPVTATPPGTVAPVQVNVTTRPVTTAPPPPPPAQANLIAATMTMAPVQAHITATLTSMALARANETSNPAAIMSPAQVDVTVARAHGNVTAAAAEQKTVDPSVDDAGVPARANIAATPMTTTTTAGQKKGDVSPPPGFTTAASSDAMEE